MVKGACFDLSDEVSLRDVHVKHYACTASITRPLVAWLSCPIR